MMIFDWIQNKITDWYYWHSLRREWREYKKDGGDLRFKAWIDWIQEFQSS